MNVKQVEDYFKKLANSPCPLTEKIIKAGYQQEKGGYIKYAIEQGIEVDYKCALPNQGWHLIESYCRRKEANVTFSKRIQCGELIFWMAEVSGAVESKDLNKLADKIIKSGITIKRRNEKKPPVKYDRRKWNKDIQELCFDKIARKVEV